MFNYNEMAICLFNYLMSSWFTPDFRSINRNFWIQICPWWTHCPDIWHIWTEAGSRKLDPGIYYVHLNCWSSFWGFEGEKFNCWSMSSFLSLDPLSLWIGLGQTIFSRVFHLESCFFHSNSQQDCALTMHRWVCM